jgi:hypothetical protein
MSRLQGGRARKLSKVREWGPEKENVLVRVFRRIQIHVFRVFRLRLLRVYILELLLLLVTIR